MGQLPDALNRGVHVNRRYSAGNTARVTGDDTRPGRDGGRPRAGGDVSGKAVISLPGSATDNGRRNQMDSPGERFARALAHQDTDALCAVLADTVDFQALTPRRHWQASTGRQAAEEIILGTWFD